MSLEQTAKANLLRVIDAYQAAQSTGDGTLSKIIYGSSWFIGELRKKTGGPNYGLRKYDEMIGWFVDNWPVGAKWPADVPHDGRLRLVAVRTRKKDQVDGEDGAKKSQRKGKAKDRKEGAGRKAA